MGLHAPEIIVLVVILLLVFGPKKLPKIGNDLGKGIHEFKSGINEITTTDTTDKKSISTGESLSSARAELDQIEHDLAVKKAQLAEKEAEKTTLSEQPSSVTK